jgi:hypothetical protein
MQAFGLLFGYGLQFLVGILLNLFVTLPASHPGSTGNEYFARSAHSLIWAFSGTGGWELALHAYIALGLVLSSAALFIRSLKQHNRRWEIAGGIAAFFTLGAFFNGLSFVNYNEDVSSFIMATCWLIAVGALVVGLVRDHARA